MEAPDVKSLEEQISGFKTTLAQLELQPASQDIVQLRKDLQELLQLSEQQLLELKKQQLLSTVQSMEEGAMQEAATVLSHQLNDSLIGQRCSVPHWSAHGVLHRQNGVICAVDAARAQVRVLISAPTRPCDLPCPRFLEGGSSSDGEAGEGRSCGPHGASCRRSHGIAVPACQLGEFEAPDLGALRERAACLVKLAGRRLWHHAKVCQVDAQGQQCVVELRHARDADGAQSCAVPWEDILPLPADEEEEEEEEWSPDGDATEEEEEEGDPSGALGPRSLTAQPAPPLWERYSSGVASRLMARMGFTPGEGLGARGQGRLEPVEIEVLPAGASLDRVMRLRERRRAREERREQRQAPARAREGKESESSGQDVFSFLNRNLKSVPSPSAGSISSRKANLAHARLLEDSSLTGIGQQLLGAEREAAEASKQLRRLSAALQRAANSPNAERLRSAVAEAEAKKRRALARVASLERHKETRKEQKKLLVF